MSMGYSLKDAELIREKLDASYSEAKEALEAADGDILGALAYIEEKRANSGEKLQRAFTDLVNRGRQLSQEGVEGLEIEFLGKSLGRFDLHLSGPAAFVVALVSSLLSLCRLKVIAHEATSEPAEAPEE